MEAFLKAHASNGRGIVLDLAISSFGEQNETPLKHAFDSIANKSREGQGKANPSIAKPDDNQPRIISFPYSRHSSYPELCHLVEIFKPKDVWPCTVNPVEWLNNGGCLGKPELKAH